MVEFFSYPLAHTCLTRKSSAIATFWSSHLMNMKTMICDKYAVQQNDNKIHGMGKPWDLTGSKDLMLT